MAKYTKADIEQAWTFLESFRGKSLRSVYLHTSSSGTSRIRFLSADADGISDVSWAIAQITESRYNCNYGCIVAPFMNMRQDFAIVSNFNYAAASHDIQKKGLDVSWNTKEGRAAIGMSEEDRIYDTYFFNANRL